MSIGSFISGVAGDVVGSVAKVVPLPSSIKRFGNKLANSKALRFGEKIAGGAVRIGHKMGSVGKAISHGADVVGKYSGKAASLLGGVPIVGTAAALVNKGVQGASLVGKGLQGVGGGLEGAGKAAQGVIRVGRSMGGMKTGGDLISSMRDVSRASQNMGGATSNLVAQARSAGSNLQRLRK